MEETSKIKNIFDSHCHYDDTRFDGDRFELIAEQLRGSVCGMLHASTGVESARFGIETAERFDGFYTSVGVHPEELDRLQSDWFEQISELASAKKVVAIGEIGLDYHYEGFDRERQIEVFTRQLRLAESLNLPVIIHSRDATEDMMKILGEFRPRGVMHCFSGSAETAREVLALGLHISFTGVLTFKGAKKATKALAEVPLDRLLLETDCPYMSPEPYRSERCQSSFIEFTAQKAGEIKGVSAQELIDYATENTRRLFGIR